MGSKIICILRCWLCTVKYAFLENLKISGLQWRVWQHLVKSHILYLTTHRFFVVAIFNYIIVFWNVNWTEKYVFFSLKLLTCTLRSWLHKISTKMTIWSLILGNNHTFKCCSTYFSNKTIYIINVGHFLDQPFNVSILSNPGNKVLKR